MKTAGEILDKRLNYQQNKNLYYYEVYSEILQAMEEYAAQFKQEKVTNEEINIEADKRYPSDKEGFPNPHGYSFASGAEWMRDKITHNK